MDRFIADHSQQDLPIMSASIPLPTMVTVSIHPSSTFLATGERIQIDEFFLRLHGYYFYALKRG